MKSTSAPWAITLSATRLPPAASSYPVGLTVAKKIFEVLSTLRKPFAKPPLILYQLSSAAEMTIPTLCVFVIFAARIPAR